MKNRIVIDLKVFALILKEVRAMKRELHGLRGALTTAQKAQPAREVKDKIYSSDVMRMLRITSATLGKYEKLGFLKFHKEGHIKVYSEAEVVEFKKMKGKRKRIGKNFAVKTKK